MDELPPGAGIGSYCAAKTPENEKEKEGKKKKETQEDAEKTRMEP